MKTKKQPIDGSKCKPLTLEEAKNLKYGDIVYFRLETDSRGALRKVKVNGQVKTWKRDTERVQVPWKYGLRDYGYITERFLDEWTLEDEPKKPTVKIGPHGYIWVAPTNQDPNYVVSCFIDFVMDIQPEVFEWNSEKAQLIKLAHDLNGKLQWGDPFIDSWTDYLERHTPEGYFFGSTEGGSGDWGYWPTTE